MTKLNILAIDDEPMILDFITFNLEEHGHHVFVANNGYEAIEILESTAIDIIISDVSMPKMNGIELLKKVKNDFHNIKKFILITGFAAISPKEAKELGADKLLSKPLDMKLLMSYVQSTQAA